MRRILTALLAAGLPLLALGQIQPAANVQLNLVTNALQTTDGTLTSLVFPSGTTTEYKSGSTFKADAGSIGNLPIAWFNSGTGASSTTAWYGDGTWKSVTASAGGSNTQVQYNNSTVLAGSSSFTFNSSTGGISVTGDSGFGGSAVTNAVLKVSGNNSAESAGSVFGILDTPTLTLTGNASDGVGLFIQPSYATGGNTGGTLVGIFLAAPSISGGGAPTSLQILVANAGSANSDAGIAIATQTGGTYNTDLLIGTAVPPGGNYGIYQSDSYTDSLNGALIVNNAITSTGLTVNGATTGSATFRSTYSAGQTNYEEIFAQGNVPAGNNAVLLVLANNYTANASSAEIVEATSGGGGVLSFITGSSSGSGGGGSTAMQLDASQNLNAYGNIVMSSSKYLVVGNSYVGGTYTTGTGSVDIEDATGTVYHVIVHN